MDKIKAQAIVAGIQQVTASSYAASRNRGVDQQVAQADAQRALLAWRVGRGYSAADVRQAVAVNTARMRAEADAQMAREEAAERAAA